MKRIALTAILSLFAPCAYAGAQPPAPFGPLDLPRPGSFRADIPAPVSDVETLGPRVTLLLNAAESNRLAPVWPGYSVFGQPILLYEKGVRSFLFAHPNPPAGYARIAASPWPVFEKQGEVPGLRFSFEFHFPYGGEDAFAYMYGPGEDPVANVRTMVHERFHVFQHTAFAPGSYVRRDSEPDGEDLALAALEQLSLKSALKAAGRSETGRYIRHYLAARGARYARTPDCRRQEEDEERSEGMALYADSVLLDRPGLAPRPGGSEAAVIRRLERLPSIDEMNKGRYYGTGAAQGLLLDRAGAGWKESVAGGRPLYDALGALYPLAGHEAEAALLEAKAAQDFGKLLAQGEKAAADYQAGKAAAIAAYEAAPGREWSVPRPNSTGYSAAGPSYKLGKNDTLMPGLRVLSADSGGIRIHFSDRPVIMAGPAIRFHAKPGAALLLDGAPAPEADGVYPFRTLSLSEGGAEIVFLAKPGALTLSGGKASVACP